MRLSKINTVDFTTHSLDVWLNDAAHKMVKYYNTATKEEWLKGADRRKCHSKHKPKQLDIPVFYGHRPSNKLNQEDYVVIRKKKVVLKTDFAENGKWGNSWKFWCFGNNCYNSKLKLHVVSGLQKIDVNAFLILCLSIISEPTYFLSLWVLVKIY